MRVWRLPWIQLSRSLDCLATNRELIEWYGDEFPLELNPFMLSKSLADKAEDMGLALAAAPGRSTYSLHAAVRTLAVDGVRNEVFMRVCAHVFFSYDCTRRILTRSWQQCQRGGQRRTTVTSCSLASPARRRCGIRGHLSDACMLRVFIVLSCKQFVVREMRAAGVFAPSEPR